jgi:NTP pyrophosphatase (non-canonical NTP hydrolase)
MAQYKNQGDAQMNLVEELSEVIQVIAKKQRFGGDWNEVPPGDTRTRLGSLKAEMEDVMLAYSRLMEEIREELMQECFLNSLENQSYEG